VKTLGLEGFFFGWQVVLLYKISKFEIPIQVVKVQTPSYMYLICLKKGTPEKTLKVKKKPS